MITLKKLNGKEVLINSELIETIEAAPDTVITLVTGNRFVVRDPVEDVRAKILEFKRSIWQTKGRIEQDWMHYKKTDPGTH